MKGWLHLTIEMKSLDEYDGAYDAMLPILPNIKQIVASVLPEGIQVVDVWMDEEWENA